MTPVQRSLAGDVLVFDLAEEMRHVREELSGGRARSARTIVKDGPLRLTIVGLGPGGSLNEHEAAGPITIQVLDGELELNAGGEIRALHAGAVVALDQRVRHAVAAALGAMFLLTLAAPTANVETR